MKNIILWAIFFTIFSLVGCGTKHPDHPRTHSSAITSYKDAALGRYFEKEASRHAGQSGFEIIRYGREAFTSRIATIGMAEKSIDLQYYLWEKDTTGRLMAHHVLAAADRGVKVRILVDDIGLKNRDEILSAIDYHHNIEVRIFNPFTNRRFHAADIAGEFERINHRMHNKTLIIDSALAIVGGRNIGDHYFGISEERNFRDLDIVAIGPIVREISSVYDYFWNGKWSVPMVSLGDGSHYSKDAVSKAKTDFQDKISRDDYPYPLDEDVKRFKKDIDRIRDGFIWASGKMVFNDPKQMRLSKEKQQGTIIEKLHRKLESVKNNLYIESPYFIPRDRGTRALIELQKKGANVRILTNSFASNDVFPAFAGYEAYREDLIKHGIDIYELRPDVGNSDLVNLKPSHTAINSGIHTKAIVLDDSVVFIGSFNLDPRSAEINTEGGIYVESPQLAEKVLAYMNTALRPEYSYHVIQDTNGALVWISQKDGKEEIFHDDPNMSLWDKLKVSLIQIMPFEDQL